MSAVLITLSGVLYDKLARTSRPVVIVGEASLTGLGVGGGPIVPEPGPGDPPHIWGGGNVPMPSPPIANVPGAPGYEPPKPPLVIWGPNDPRPTPPIYIPPVQPPKPPDGEAVKPPPDDGGWGYFPEYGWGYFPQAGEAGPKGK